MYLLDQSGLINSLHRGLLCKFVLQRFLKCLATWHQGVVIVGMISHFSSKPTKHQEALFYCPGRWIIPRENRGDKVLHFRFLVEEFVWRFCFSQVDIEQGYKVREKILHGRKFLACYQWIMRVLYCFILAWWQNRNILYVLAWQDSNSSLPDNPSIVCVIAFKQMMHNLKNVR